MRKLGVVAGEYLALFRRTLCHLKRAYALGKYPYRVLAKVLHRKRHRCKLRHIVPQMSSLRENCARSWLIRRGTHRKRAHRERVAISENTCSLQRIEISAHQLGPCGTQLLQLRI